MSAAQDSATTASAPSTPSAANAPVDKMDKMDTVDPSVDSTAAAKLNTVPPVAVVTTAAAVKKPSILSQPARSAVSQSPVRSAVTKSKAASARPRPPRCKTCRAVANPMVGTCSGCSIIFCSSHRLPEDHACEQAEKRRAELQREHRDLMMRNATRQNKIIQF